MARRDARWRMYLLCLAADMRDAGLIDEAQYRRIVGRVDDMDARDVVRVLEAVFPSEDAEAVDGGDGKPTGCNRRKAGR